MMRNFWAIFAVIFAFTFILAPADAEAKKLGGGKSFGKLFSTAPAKKPLADNKNNSSQTANKTNTQNNTANKPRKGLMGGLLGGLLAGGLIAALLGGAFEGIQFMDILIIALLAFVGYRLFKAMSQSKASSMNRAAYAGNSTLNPQDTTQHFESTASFGGTSAKTTDSNSEEVPLDLPPGFDLNGFLSGACDHYRTLQEAWNKADSDTIREYTSPNLAEDLIAERSQLDGDQHTEVMYVDADLVRAHQVFGTAQVSIKFSGRYRDSVENVEEDISDIWHLERDLKEPNAPWYIIGIEN
ncbi:Tim44 domain-containing protein [Litoribrevibacter albus]|uniref:Preprotein translocase subunit Tim44 n=1 Tax=Litoribrevibacter albus TaxID=1473156 RepID=A0AA37SAQ7_9GAMM|nr:TIM44-like domain-containing protein [Litoribrevibacter albus]GLQ31595.1 preprotein translocase subunit Tim44 [Litoribrevibacter albus]